jgi:hypothetical protein
VQRAEAASEDAKCLAALAANGCYVLAPDEIDIAAFQQSSRAVREEAMERLSPDIRACLQSAAARNIA